MKIWAYGDSFTAGDGTKLKNHKWECPNPGKKKFWLDYISEFYKVEETINRGIGGLSNNLIFLRLLNDLKYFEKGDLVIVGQTYAEREEFWANNIYKEDIDNDHHWVWWAKKVQPVGSTHDTLIDEIADSEDFRKEIIPRAPHDVFTSLMSHIGNTKAPLLSYYESYYTLKYELLLDHIQSLGVNTFFWKVPREADRYQTIWQATNGRISDSHWSWKGSEMFGRGLTKKIKLL